MASQPLAFAQLLAGGVLLTAGISGRSIPDVLSGNIRPFRPIASDLPAPAGSSSIAGTADTALTSSDSPAGVGHFEGTPVAAWIVPILQYARQHGWRGKVNSGYRTFAQQQAIYRSGVRPAAVPGTSNHESDRFPGGAIDVSDAPQLAQILRGSPYASKLVWAGAKDPVHFSHPHNGSY